MTQKQKPIAATGLQQRPMSDCEEEDEDPQDSAAARAIRFSLPCSVSAEEPTNKIFFAPVFTHQCFPGEHIPGYHPAEAAAAVDAEIMTINNRKQQHSSFEHSATHRIAIGVLLAPACHACRLTVDIRPLKRGALEEASPNEEASPQRKRLHREGGDDDDEESLGSEDSESENDEDAAVEEEPPKRLTEDEIREQLQKFLPPIMESTASLNYLSAPLGKLVSEYNRNGMDFCLALCPGRDCVDYHNCVQKLAPWYIESASDIDPMEDDGHAWKMLYLFRKHGPEEYSLVGYSTLYHFDSPFRKPVGGILVRVCQAIILPPYQRMGHGKTMLHTVFDVCAAACDDSKKIVEINVEDPAPAFSALRDVVDWERYLRAGKQWFHNDSSNSGSRCQDITDAAFFATLKESEALEITAQALTTVRQVQTVYELDRLQRLQQHLQSTTNLGNDVARELLEKRFRLMVKQRLKNQNREDILAQCGDDKAAIRELLSEMFDTVYSKYTALLRRTSGTSNNTEC